MKKINKTTAKKMFENGETFVMVPNKLRPDNMFISSIVDGSCLKDYTTFEKLYDSFRYYNCNYETGYYPAFYVED